MYAIRYRTTEGGWRAAQRDNGNAIQRFDSLTVARAFIRKLETRVHGFLEKMEIFCVNEPLKSFPAR